MSRPVTMFLLFLLCAVLAAGCGQRVQVQIPPKAPVDGVRTIAIAPFDNVTADAGLAYDIEEQIAKVLRDSGWYRSVIMLRQVVSFPAGRAVTFEDVRQLAAAQGADAVILGTATYYFDDVFMGVPQCSGCNRQDVLPTWSVTQHTHVVVHFSARLIEVATGRELHGLQARGEDTDYLTQFISHREATPPPESLVPKPNRLRIPDTRRYAIQRAVTQFTRDLVPTYEWRSVE